jgi:hypothetical protein
VYYLYFLRQTSYVRQLIKNFKEKTEGNIITGQNEEICIILLADNQIFIGPVQFGREQGAEENIWTEEG